MTNDALSRLGPEELCIGVLKKTGQRRRAVWVPHTNYFQFRDEPPGIAEPHEVDEWYPVAFKR